MTRLWEVIFGPPVPYSARRSESLDKIRGLMREREQIEQSGEPWRIRMRDAVKAFEALADEVLAARGSYGQDDSRDPE